MFINKLKNHRGLWIVGALFALVLHVFATQAAAPRENSKEKLNCQFLGPIQGVYFSQHINFSPKEKKKISRQELEKRTIEQYIKKMDGSKIYFLASDIKKIKEMMSGILSQVEKRPEADCSALHQVQNIYVKRLKERVAFAKKYLGKDFKFKKSTKLILDPDHRNHPKTIAEADQFQKKYIQFQISNFMATDMTLQESKQKVVRRYERSLSHVEEVKNEDIYSNYLDAFSRSMDPHSSYFSADTLEDFRINMSLSLEGIGATLTNDDGFTVIEQLIPGGAAARDGRLHPKDKIIAVGQGDDCQMAPENKEKKCEIENVVEMELRNVVKRIRGKKGTKVILSILRGKGKKKERFNITLVRDKVKLEDDAVSIHYIDHEVNGHKFKIGLIDLPSFYADSKVGGRTSAGDMKKVLKEARKKKVDGVVLDFSSNGGGSLDDAVKIAGLFFKTGAVVKQSAKKGNSLELADEDEDVDYAGPLVVLTSRISASASEIVAGTLKDYKRAVVVGADHTFGKGTVQSVIPLPPGYGAAKVTVGMFYTAGGNSTQHRGVNADIVFPGIFSNDEVGENTLDYSLPPSSLAPFLSKTAYVEEGKEHWQRVTSGEIEKLRNFSEIRIAHSDDFKKILEDIKKAKEKDHLVELEESFDQLVENDKKSKNLERDELGNLKKEQRVAEYLKRADIKEAINVAGDLVALRRGIEIRLGATAKKKKTGETIH